MIFRELKYQNKTQILHSNSGPEKKHGEREQVLFVVCKCPNSFCIRKVTATSQNNSNKQTT